MTSCLYAQGLERLTLFFVLISTFGKVHFTKLGFGRDVIVLYKYHNTKQARMMQKKCKAN